MRPLHLVERDKWRRTMLREATRELYAAEILLRLREVVIAWNVQVPDAPIPLREPPGPFKEEQRQYIQALISIEESWGVRIKV